MQTTTNFNLKKPEASDVANIANLNDNADTIDALLAARPAMHSATVTVPAAGGTVTVTGMTAGAAVIVGPDPASHDVYAAAGCRCTAQASNSLTFTVNSTASAAMSVNVLWFII